ncbi:MAG: permease-like cell division protein FtsX [bacterium]|nr:permease-like cell division protein FtsX [bacterium]
MRIRLVKYFFKEAWLSLERSAALSIITVLTIAVALSVLGIFFWVISNLEELRASFGKEVAIIVFLNEGYDNKQIDQLVQEIRNIDGVSEVVYLPKDKALAEFMKDAEVKREIQLLGFNPLPDTLEVRTATAFSKEKLENIAEQILQMPIVDSVDYGQEWVERLSQFLKVIRFFAVIVGTVIVGATLVIIANTIRLTIHNRRDEIEVMKLVGATDWLVRGPFILEGFVQGLLGAIVAVTALYGIYNLTLVQIGGVAFITYPFILGLVFGGMMLGCLGAMISLRRYLRV